MGWLELSANGKYAERALPMNSSLSNHIGCPLQSARAKDAIVSEKISTLPDGVASGAPSGSAGIARG